MTAPSQPTPLICVWDLDETLVIFDSLRKGTYATAIDPTADPDRCLRLGAELSSLLVALLDGLFAFRRLEAVDINRCSPCTGETVLPSGRDCKSDSTDRAQGPSKRPRLTGSDLENGTSKNASGPPSTNDGERQPLATSAACHRSAALGLFKGSAADLATATLLAGRASAVFAGGEASLVTSIPPRWLEARRATLAEVDEVTGAWRRLAAQALAEVVRRGGVNVLVTASHATAALGKLLLFGLGADVVAPHRVYSASHRSKGEAFAQVLEDLTAENEETKGAWLRQRPAASSAAESPGNADCSSAGQQHCGATTALPGSELPAAVAAHVASPASLASSLAVDLAVVCVGDGDEEAQAAAALGLAFVRVRRARDLGLVAAACDAALLARAAAARGGAGCHIP